MASGGKIETFKCVPAKVFLVPHVLSLLPYLLSCLMLALLVCEASQDKFVLLRNEAWQLYDAQIHGTMVGCLKPSSWFFFAPTWLSGDRAVQPTSDAR